MPFDPRPAWNASPPTATIPRWAPGRPFGVAWHYIGAGRFDPADHATCLGWVHNMQHADQAGTSHTHDHYFDLAYNLCCCPHGHVIEGRGLWVTSGAQLGGNSDWLGVLLMRGSADTMTPAMQAAANDARALLLAYFPHATAQVGHRDVAGNPTGTPCPGPFEAWVHAGGAGRVTPAPPPPPPQPTIWTVADLGAATVRLHTVQMTVDKDGNGWSAVPGVRVGDVVGVYPITLDPAHYGAYWPNYRCGIADRNGQAILVVENAWPSSRVTIRVTATR